MNELSRRERNKQDKLIRIKAAAEELFCEKGFDQTTTRMIAKKADVALATLFLYATDKRDLLFLVCNDDLEKLAQEAFADVPDDAPLIEQLTICFMRFFVFFGRNRNLSRDLLRELTFYTEGRQSAVFQMIRKQNILRIGELVAKSQMNKRVRTQEDPDIIAQTIFYLLAAELRLWLSKPKGSAESGMRSLRIKLALLIQGLGPKKGDI